MDTTIGIGDALAAVNALIAAALWLRIGRLEGLVDALWKVRGTESK